MILSQRKMIMHQREVHTTYFKIFKDDLLKIYYLPVKNEKFHYSLSICPDILCKFKLCTHIFQYFLLVPIYICQLYNNIFKIIKLSIVL